MLIIAKKTDDAASALLQLKRDAEIKVYGRLKEFRYTAKNKKRFRSEYFILMDNIEQIKSAREVRKDKSAKEIRREKKILRKLKEN